MQKDKSSRSNLFSFSRHDYTGKQGEFLVDEHYHDFYEIYYIENGYCNYFIDSKSFSLVPGDLVLIPQGVIHNTLYTENKPSRLLVHCSETYIPSAALSMFTKSNYLYRNSDITKGISEILYKIQDESIMPDEFSDDVIKCHMRMLMFTLVRNENQYKISDSKSSYIEKAISYVQKNLAYDISLSETANIFSVSSEHFSRKFKKETGFGFNEYVNLLRMKKAEALLKNESISVSEVADLCGFNDCNYFSAKFKKLYGVSPKALQMMSRAAKQICKT